MLNFEILNNNEKHIIENKSLECIQMTTRPKSRKQQKAINY